MSLATTCPQCKTSFKVVPDQLKLRRGLVRCGMCRHVFSGVDFLRYVEEAPSDARSIPAPSIPARSTPAAAPDMLAPDMLAPDTLSPDTLSPDALSPDTLSMGARPGTTQAPAAEAEVPSGAVTESMAAPGERDAFFDTQPLTEDRAKPRAASEPRGPLPEIPAGPVVREPHTRPGSTAPTRPLGTESAAHTAQAFVVGEAAIGEETAPIARARALREREEPSLRESIVGAGDGDGEDAVDFFATSSRARGFSTRGTVFAAIASFVLAVALLLQLIIGSRDWLAVRLPAARPVLAAAVAPLGLRVQPPRELDDLTIESFELQSAGARNMLALNALLRNGADHALRWPAMELSLTEAGGTIVVRKVLLPQDYLGAAQGELPGIGARAGWPVRVALRADGVEATGYSVKLFYP